MEKSTSISASSNQITNQILLEAIKIKFSEQNTINGTTTLETNEDLPFSITSNPISTTTKNLHKFMTGTSSTNDNKKNCPSCKSSNKKLNEFLLEQLSEKRLNGELASTTTTAVSNNGFILPQLQLSDEKNTRSAAFMLPNLTRNDNREHAKAKFSLPNSLIGKSTVGELAKTTTGDWDIHEVDKALGELKVDNEDSNKNNIDLTSALSSFKTCKDYNPATHVCSIHVSNNQKSAEEFNIPFVDCDLPQPSHKFKKNIVPSAINANDYCQTDISHLVYKHTLFNPSPFGRVICLNYRRKASLRKANLIIAYKFKAKHRITPFLFDTQSPDDKILAALSKYHRQN